MYVYAIANQKGGIGKTATAHTIGAGFRKAGFNTLLIDLDAQQDLTLSVGHMPNANPSIFEVLIGRATIAEVVRPIKDNLSYAITPASDKLSTIDAVLQATGKEYKLKEALSADELKQYDIVVIDCPPSLGTLTINALTACNELIIPVKGDLFSLQALKQTAKTVADIKKYTNPNLVIGGILLTQYNPRTVLHPSFEKMLKEFAEDQGTHIFNAHIRNGIAIAEAQAQGEDIFTYAPKSGVADDYNELLKELLKHYGK